MKIDRIDDFGYFYAKTATAVESCIPLYSFMVGLTSLTLLENLKGIGAQKLIFLANSSKDL